MVAPRLQVPVTALLRISEARRALVVGPVPIMAPYSLARPPEPPRVAAAPEALTCAYPSSLSLHQIDPRVWLTELSRALGRPAALDDIPDAALNRVAGMGFDSIHLLSVWRTGSVGQRSWPGPVSSLRQSVFW